MRLQRDGAGVSRDVDMTDRSNDFSNYQPQKSSYDFYREQADRQRQNRHAGPRFQNGWDGYGNNNRINNNTHYNRRPFASGGRYHRQNVQGTGPYGGDQMMVDAPQQPSRNWNRRLR